MRKVLNLKFEMLEYQNKNIFAKVHIPNWSEEVFVIKKVKNTAPLTQSISDLRGKKLLEHFAKNNSKKQIKKN